MTARSASVYCRLEARAQSIRACSGSLPLFVWIRFAATLCGWLAGARAMDKAAFMASFDRYSDEAALNGSAISRGEAAAAMAEAALTEHAMSRGVAAAVAAEAALARPRMSSRSFRQAALSPAAAYRIMYPRARQLYDNAHA